MTRSRCSRCVLRPQLPWTALVPSFLQAVRTMPNAAFDADVTDDDWSHAIGGLHVWLMDPLGLP